MTENDKALRHLASVRKIAELRPIPDADNIVAARVDGWDTVVKKGEYEVGDLAVYCEIDSLIPHRVAPFLTKKKEGITGNEVNRLKTLRLRGQISQGLLIKPEAISNGLVVLKSVDGVKGEFSLGDDVTEFLGITKYEAPIPGNLVSIMRGGFPGFIRKTDQERIQNFAEGLPKWKERRLLFEVTEKLDGSSMTVYVKDEEEGVCSRNINLLNTEEVTFWQVAKRDNLIAKLRTLGRNLALQGELVGPGIQGNRYKLTSLMFYCFDVYDIDRSQLMFPRERRTICQSLGILHVPVLDDFEISEEARVKIGTENVPVSVDSLLKMAESKSKLSSKVDREGLVFKAYTTQLSFKAISNLYLLKGGE